MANARQRGKGYQLTVSLGSDGKGNRKILTKTWYPPEGMSEAQAIKEAKHQAEIFERTCKSGNNFNINIKLREFIEYWQKEHGDKLRYKTRSRYYQMLPRINAALGEIRLSKLSKQHILEFYRNLSESEVRKDVKYRAINPLNDLLIKKQITKAKFAVKTGLCENTLRIALQGKNVRFETAEKIAQTLDVKPEELFEPVNVRLCLLK